MTVIPARPRRTFTSVAYALAGIAFLASVLLWAGTQVNAVAFLVGAEKQATFVPQAYGQECGKGGCHVVTDGYVQHTGEHLTWEGKVPLGKPFVIRVPVTRWAGAWLVEDTGSAIGDLAFTVVFDLAAVFFGLYFLTQGRLRIFRAMERRFGRRSRRSNSQVRRAATSFSPGQDDSSR